MAHAQYETRTRTVEETVVVLTLTEDEAEELAGRLLYDADDSERMREVVAALRTPAAPETAPDQAGDTFDHNGITYEYGVLYRDPEGDYFEMRRETDAGDGTPVGRYRYLKPTAEPGEWSWTLAEVVGTHGPLTKVTP
ncbi:phiSA1p31-related protein [Streptomyces sp. NPDC056638]|uniref:phiSA1p31-related protein n=1 Tax=Streptomyces sp. NPDC056638 TaxID=3345887 RepID=UPI003695FFB2